MSVLWSQMTGIAGWRAEGMGGVDSYDFGHSLSALLPGLRRYARSLVKDREQADDLVQDCLERIVRSGERTRDAGGLKAFAFTILHNLAMDFFRQRARRGVAATLDDVEDDRLAQPPDQEAGLAGRNLLEALDRLPENMRAVLLLVGVEDLSYNEAAAVLDVPMGTLMSRLHRAREQLRRDLAGEDRSASTSTGDVQ